MKAHYFAWYDSEYDTTIIAFGTEDEILDDTLAGNSLDPNEFEKLQYLLNDTCELGEDYLISTEDYSVSQIKDKLDKLGYIWDSRLKNVGWG